MVDKLGRYARSVVADAYLQIAPIEGAADLDLAAGGRVFDGVAQEVRHHLKDAIGVARDGRYPAAERDGDAVLGARHARPSCRVAQKRIDIDGPQVELHATGFHAVEVQHLGDHPAEALSIGVDVPGELLYLLRLSGVVAHHLALTLYPRNGTPQLVPHHTHELPLNLP